MTFWTALLAIVIFFWTLFKEWVYIFFVPFTNLDILWIIIPVWIAWFFAEFFQEKKGTSFGNAISNGVIPFWVGIDWTRTLTNFLIDGKVKFGWLMFGKYFLSVLMILFGFMIIFYGIKGKSFIHFTGRIRVVTYFCLVFTPLIYGLVKPDLNYFLAIIIYAPLFYYIIEFIDRITPDPGAIKGESGEKKQETFTPPKF